MRTDEGEVEPQTVDQARDAVERSRERISATLDQLEDRIVEKKHELQGKADVLRPVKKQVRQRPLTAVAVAVGLGALIGSLGGGHAKRSRSRHSIGELSDEDARREMREWREHRRERLRALASGHDPYRGRWNGRSSSRFDSLKGQLIGAATTAITAAITSRLKEFARGSSGSDRMSDSREESRY